MTREEVKQLLAIIQAAFPNFKVADKTTAVNAWLMLLEEYPANDVMLAYKAFCKNDNSGFAPSVSQLISQLEKPKELAVMDDAKAWDLVKKAIMRSTYHSQEEFDRLPPTIQKAIGSANMLYSWAIDENYADGVISSQFLKNYRQVCQRQKDYDRLPRELQNRVEGFIEQCPRLEDGALLIGSTKSVQPKTVNPEPAGTYTEKLKEKLDADNEDL